MRTQLTCLVTIFAALIGMPALCNADANPASGVGGGNTLVAFGPNNLVVDESIVILGPGTFQYTYTFNNADPDAIWHFLLYTPFATSAGTAAGFPLNL